MIITSDCGCIVSVESFTQTKIVKVCSIHSSSNDYCSHDNCYECRIIKILKANGGEFRGFNKLLEAGRLHPNTLDAYLKDMKKRHVIEVVEADKKTKIYRLIQ